MAGNLTKKKFQKISKNRHVCRLLVVYRCKARARATAEHGTPPRATARARRPQGQTATARATTDSASPPRRRAGQAEKAAQGASTRQRPRDGRTAGNRRNTRSVKGRNAVRHAAVHRGEAHKSMCGNCTQVFAMLPKPERRTCYAVGYELKQTIITPERALRTFASFAYRCGGLLRAAWCVGMWM